MELTNEFSVPVPPDQAWLLLTDMAMIGPCMPGATITSVEGDQFEGSVKIKVGPIMMTFKGAGEFTEKDEAGRRAVLIAKGRDQKGNGTAQATIVATMLGEGAGTKVLVATDLTITGKAAQFGGTVIKDISASLLGQFAVNLAALVADAGSDDEPAADDAEPSESPLAAPPRADRREPEPTGEVDAIKLLIQSDAARAQARTAATAVVSLCLAVFGLRRFVRSIRRARTARQPV